MNSKPTIPELFLEKYYWPTVRENKESNRNQEDLFDIAIERFTNQEGFSPGIKFTSLARHIKAEQKAKPQ